MREKRYKVSLFLTTLVIAFTFLFSVTTVPVFAQSDLKYPKVLRFASLSPGTLLYAIISGFCKVASDNSPMTMIVVPTAGPPTWLPMMTKQGTIDIGMENYTSLYQMWTGEIAPKPIMKGFPEKPPYPQTPTTRILMSGTLLRIGMLVRKDSGINSYADLKGKKIAWGWSAFPQNIAITLANLANGGGLSIDDVKTIPMTEVVAGVRAVQEGRIDATSCAVGMGAIAEADALVGVRFLPASMDPERIKAGQRAMPGGYPTVQKGGIPGVPQDTPMWSLPLANIATTRMPDHVAYKVVETWWNNHKQYAPIHPLLRFWTPETYLNENMTMPYHDGAIKFYKEKGVWTPKLEAKNQALLAGK